MIHSKGAAMNIFDIQEAKIKAYLKFLYNSGATAKSKSIAITEVERALRMDNRMFDDITKYLLAEGYTQRAPGRGIYLTRAGVSNLK
jgi:hypothetical protein